MAALVRKEERAGLLSNLGPCCKALCFRRDSAIRRQLVKNEKASAFVYTEYLKHGNIYSLLQNISAVRSSFFLIQHLLLLVY